MTWGNVLCEGKGCVLEGEPLQRSRSDILRVSEEEQSNDDLQTLHREFKKRRSKQWGEFCATPKLTAK